jgi:polyphenol oxidase
VARRVTEAPPRGAVPLRTHPEWSVRFPWLLQGTTGRGPASSPFDLGLSGEQPVGAVLERWRSLLRELGVPSAVHARQVHRADLRIHRAIAGPGILVMDGVDGHVTDRAGLLLTVSVADCVPVSVVDPAAPAIALVHAGWRGTAAGIVERALDLLRADRPDAIGRLWLHCGPAICGACYEVGPDVHAAVNPGTPVPDRPTPIDIREAIVRRAIAAGLAAERISVSSHCTRCGPDDFFSHRGGSAGRQMGLLGIRPGTPRGDPA